MYAARRARRRQRLNQRELRIGLVYGILIVAAILCGMYLSIWLMNKEEEQEHQLPKDVHPLSLSQP